MLELEPIRFPLEIVELVIDHSFDDRETLRSCSLVSFQWGASSRLHLFRTVTFRNAHSIQTLVELLESPLSTLARAIRRVFVEIGLNFKFNFTRDQVDNYAPYLTRFSDVCAVESLQFIQHSSPSGARAFSESYQLFLPPWSCFKSIRSLRFDAVDASANMKGFIASFPALRELEMDRMFWRSELWDQALSTIPPPHLRAVRISRSPMDVILDWLLLDSSHSPPTSRLLELSSISDRQTVSVARYVEACGPVLEHLSLSLRLSREDFVPLDLTRNTNLRYFRIEPDLYLEALPHMLCSLTSASLERLELVMPSRLARLFPHDAARWADLDRHLLQPQFSRLFIMVQLPKAIDEEVIREYLPMCTARGIISYTYKPMLYSGSYFSI
ncbi:hypothetical protein B0H19DRAFT_1257126 [Mycena capillaripes]|nr:hypothetical protein B0H19DRAFT_1257126 [Mycena capillaripes]